MASTAVLAVCVAVCTWVRLVTGQTAQFYEIQDLTGEEEQIDVKAEGGCPLSGKFLYKDTRCWVTGLLQSPRRVAGEHSACHVISGPERGLFACKRGHWIPAAQSAARTPTPREKRFRVRIRWRRRSPSPPPPPPPPPNQAPYFTSCSGNIHVTAPARQRTAVVTWRVHAVDPEGSPTLTQTAGRPSGSSFNEGGTLISYTARDSAGATAVCAFQVTVSVVRCSYVQELSHFAAGSQSCSGVEKNIHGSVCRHTCHTGHVLQGHQDVTCQSSATWSSAFPSCQPVSCGDPGRVSGGHVLCPQGHVFPHTCTVHCLPGYNNSGITSVTCGSSGQWSSQLSPCADVEGPTFPNGCPANQNLFSGPLESPVTLTWSDPVTTDNSGQAVTLTSDLARGSRVGVGSHKVTITASDLAGNTASCSLVVTVKARTCGALVTPAHGHVTCTSGDVEGSECTITCDVGFELKGADKLTCLSTEQWDFPLSTCEAIMCSPPPAVQHGVFTCLAGHQNPAVCTLTCEPGFVVQPPADIQCQRNASWSSLGSCLDVEAPVFVSGCPTDKHSFASALGEDTLVQWRPPAVTDNSKEPVDLQSDVMSNTSFPVGLTVVTYTARDQTGNAASCQFVVNVTALFCQAPIIDSLVIPANHSLIYTCNDGYVHGARCTLSCSQGYTLVGEGTITCARDYRTHPPAMGWEWFNGAAGKPQCKEDRCSPLRPPKNGALSCHLGNLGWDCVMSCNALWDVPAYTSGHFLCVNAVQRWLHGSEVPDCVVRMLPGRVRIQTALFYHTGSCNTSVDALRQQYITRISSSIFKDACVNVPSCAASNIQVSCGPSTPFRGRRETNSIHPELLRALRRLTRDASAARHLLNVTIEVHMPYVEEGSATPEEAYKKYLLTQELLLQKLRNDVRRGRLTPGGVVVGGRGVVGSPSLRVDCPPGTVPRPDHRSRSRFSCVGCPEGQSLSPDSQRCL
ncbi:sushi, von Willebrand factor type A, EGF and pentraxin domain-containing protein 1-like isoform X2 [Babylonia areolata]|uniref:sushi, von Willebrand factor type A, EGF and pentraxin domain-containing protein 1-like isoform X2 n=1 Tax=Babylonia areolata TaxID=304850 RepID=UPI003FD1E7CD